MTADQERDRILRDILAIATRIWSHGLSGEEALREWQEYVHGQHAKPTGQPPSPPPPKS